MRAARVRGVITGVLCLYDVGARPHSAPQAREGSSTAAGRHSRKAAFERRRSYFLPEFTARRGGDVADGFLGSGPCLALSGNAAGFLIDSTERSISRSGQYRWS